MNGGQLSAELLALHYRSHCLLVKTSGGFLHAPPSVLQSALELVNGGHLSAELAAAPLQ
jgi:hypothetical protein